MEGPLEYKKEDLGRKEGQLERKGEHLKKHEGDFMRHSSPPRVFIKTRVLIKNLFPTISFVLFVILFGFFIISQTGCHSSTKMFLESSNIKNESQMNGGKDSSSNNNFGGNPSNVASNPSVLPNPAAIPFPNSGNQGGGVDLTSGIPSTTVPTLSPAPAASAPNPPAVPSLSPAPVASTPNPPAVPSLSPAPVASTPNPPAVPTLSPAPAASAPNPPAVPTLSPVSNPVPQSPVPSYPQSSQSGSVIVFSPSLLSNRTFVPGCINGENWLNTNCEYNGGMRAEDIYAARIDIKDGTEITLKVDRAETGEASSSVEMILSNSAGNLNPTNTNCRAVPPNNIIWVMDETTYQKNLEEIQKSSSSYKDLMISNLNTRCIVPAHTTFFLNIFPWGVEGALCGHGYECRVQLIVN